MSLWGPFTFKLLCHCTDKCFTSISIPGWLGPQMWNLQVLETKEHMVHTFYNTLSQEGVDGKKANRYI